jgi:hypothetical protein
MRCECDDEGEMTPMHGPIPISSKALDKVLVLELALCDKPFRHLLELGFRQLSSRHRVAQMRLRATPPVRCVRVCVRGSE